MANASIAKIDYISKQTTFQNLQTLQGEPGPDLHLNAVQEQALNHIFSLNDNDDHDTNEDNDPSDQDILVNPQQTALLKLQKTKLTPMDLSTPFRDDLLGKTYSQSKYCNDPTDDQIVNAKVREKIAKDPYMNDEEKENAMKHFIEEGFYQHTASETADDNRKTPELKNVQTMY